MTNQRDYVIISLIGGRPSEFNIHNIHIIKQKMRIRRVKEKPFKCRLSSDTGNKSVVNPSYTLP